MLIKKIRNTKPAERPGKQNSKHQMPVKHDLHSSEGMVGFIPEGGDYVMLLLYIPFLSYINIDVLNNHTWAQGFSDSTTSHLIKSTKHLTTGFPSSSAGLSCPFQFY